jgi:para-aminobenzoate synthetase/4-amino-4-deoxychorismate lyase
VCHSAWINTGRQQVMSLSPELFLRRDGQIVRTRPMKGTMRRGRWFEEDQTLERALPSDPKNRAENVMIVDLMRNDFGRVCRFGTVQVAQALAVERYRTLFQMTSEVVGQLRAGTSIESLLRATFPPGSVTGTPKLRAITLIDELEKESRGVYCGTIGLFRPGGDCLLNVAIRTIVQQDDTCELGLGSGIVADSDPAAEWQEVWLKGRFLQAEPPSFQLLETLFAPSQQTPLYLDEHLERLRQSAAYFGWSFSEKEVRALLRAASGKTGGDSRLRVLVAEHGACAVERRGTAPPPERPVKVLLAQRRTNSNNVFLYHKTTERGAYDADWHAARQQGFFDLVYRNQDGDITEGAITNLIAEIDGQWYTPPLSCGLLPGIWRAAVVRQRGVKERRLQLEDLLRATRIVLGNSVRGAVELDQVYSASQREPIWTRLCRPRGGLQWD